MSDGVLETRMSNIQQGIANRRSNLASANPTPVISSEACRAVVSEARRRIEKSLILQTTMISFIFALDDTLPRSPATSATLSPTGHLPRNGDVVVRCLRFPSSLDIPCWILDIQWFFSNPGSLAMPTRPRCRLSRTKEGLI